MATIFQKVLIVGAGNMGHQLALHCAVHGYSVNLLDISEKSIQDAKSLIQKELNKRKANNNISQKIANSIFNKISFYTDLKQSTKNVEFVIEAVNEILEQKQEVFKQLDAFCSHNTILATSTSSIRPSQLGGVTNRPDKIIAMNFENPVWETPVVELMRSSETSNKIFEITNDFVKSIELWPLKVSKEQIGFAFNRLWRVIKKECLRIASEGIANYEDIDRMFQMIFQTEVAPYKLMDKVGLDVIRDIENVYYNESGDKSDKPPSFLDEMVKKGDLGKKTGKGFYSYNDD